MLVTSTFFHHHPASYSPSQLRNDAPLLSRLLDRITPRGYVCLRRYSSLIGTEHSGRGFLRESVNGACSDLEFASGLPVVAVSAKLAGSEEACGLFAKVNLRDSPDTHNIFQVTDICEGCEKDSLGLTSQAIHQFTNSDSLEIDWEFVSADDVEGQSDDNEPVKTTTSAKPTKTTTSAKPTKTTTSSSKPTSKPSHDDNDDSEDDHSTSNFKTHCGRGTWFSDTRGSCGENFFQNDMITALNEHDMRAQWGSGSKCGQNIRVSVKGYPGKSVLSTPAPTDTATAVLLTCRRPPSKNLLPWARES
ncbi:hypothetical protein BG006_005782 [Podila minutissima]|uniref:Uncharacterized protein n=1 Tax=Podila minutissima TaxID=64525 RepID=A0A9P5SKD4_9FUNG|nr:hypothetical protein BG006_005782 [Podila minutissima]